MLTGKKFSSADPTAYFYIQTTYLSHAGRGVCGEVYISSESSSRLISFFSNIAGVRVVVDGRHSHNLLTQCSFSGPVPLDAGLDVWGIRPIQTPWHGHTWLHTLEATRVAPAWGLPPLASTIRAIKGYLFILYTNKNLDDVLYAKAKVLLYLVRQAPNVQKDLVWPSL